MFDTSTIILAISGSSLDGAARTIRMYRDAGLRVLAVVSASESDESAALARANAMPATTDEHVQAWVRTAPARRAAERVRGELMPAGSGAPRSDPAALSPTVRGPVLCGEGRSVNARAIDAAWAESGGLIVLPAGAALTADRRPAILADGSALATALFIGARLGLPVRAVREGGSLAAWAGASAVGFDEALELDLGASDRRAVLYARRHGVPFEVATPAARVSTVGAGGGTAGAVIPDDPPDVSSRVGRVPSLRFRPVPAPRSERSGAGAWARDRRNAPGQSIRPRASDEPRPA